MNTHAPSTGSSEPLIPKHGGYRKLSSFRVAQAVYDATVVFCDRFIDRRSRTHDQMVQAARSGVRNIEEGSAASGTSKKTEIKLTNVARASLEELIRDYEDFLRHRGLAVWHKDSPQARIVRERYRADPSDPSDASDAHQIRTASPEVAANTLLCLAHQASFLLGRQLDRLARDFEQHGGFTERLHAMRSRARNPDPPACPVCGRPMRLRTARRGPNTGTSFWGCSAFPDCRGVRQEKSETDSA